MGTLMYGAGHVWAGRAHFYLPFFFFFPCIAGQVRDMVGQLL